MNRNSVRRGLGNLSNKEHKRRESSSHVLASDNIVLYNSLLAVLLNIIKLTKKKKWKIRKIPYGRSDRIGVKTIRSREWCVQTFHEGMRVSILYSVCTKTECERSVGIEEWLIFSRGDSSEFSSPFQRER